MSPLPVPRHEPEVVAAAARINWQGDDSHVPTTSLKRVEFEGVTLKSAFGKAEEYETMIAMIARIPLATRSKLKSISCDSKPTAAYNVVLRPCRPPMAMEIAKLLEQECLGLHSGHNGVLVSLESGGNLFLSPRSMS